MLVKVEPEYALFTSDTLSMSHHKMKNTSEGRVAVRVSCTNTAIYSAHPHLSVLDPGNVVDLTLRRDAAPEDIATDFLEAIACPATTRLDQVAALFARTPKHDDTKMNVSFSVPTP